MQGVSWAQAWVPLMPVQGSLPAGLSKDGRKRYGAVMAARNIAFLAGDSPQALRALERLSERYGQTDPDSAEVVVALGGDGFMLQILHRFANRKVPVYGMNRGSVGFLMNDYDEEGLPQRLDAAELTSLHPLRMHAVSVSGAEAEALAINEVSLLRQTHQAAKIKVSVDGQVRLEQLICDGVLIATPAGSTAYNLSAHGPILPIDSGILALTPISAFRPRRWRGALLPSRAEVSFEVLDAARRPVSAVADTTEVRDISRVQVSKDQSIDLDILFDPGHGLEERILKEQFFP